MKFSRVLGRFLTNQILSWLFYTTFLPNFECLGFFIFLNSETVLVTPPIKLCNFFNLKNCNRNFIFAFGSKMPLARFAFVLYARIMCWITNCLLFCLIVFFWGGEWLIAIFFYANTVCLCVAITNLVMQYFLLFCWCRFRHMAISILWNGLCICLLSFLLFWFVC